MKQSSAPGPEVSDGTGRRFALAGGIWAVALGSLAVVCCGAAPSLLVVFGSLTIGATAGLAAGVLALGILGAIVVLARRRRRACQQPAAARTAPNSQLRRGEA